MTWKAHHLLGRTGRTALGIGIGIAVGANLFSAPPTAGAQLTAAHTAATRSADVLKTRH
jgi:hypothetical protein